MIANPRLSIVTPTFNNVEVLRRSLDSWEQFAANQPIEIIVIEDGCRDATAAFLQERANSPWGRAHLRWVHADNIHELRATNRGVAEARAPLVMTWHDDMFLASSWLVPELLATFEHYPDLGLLCLCRGLLCHHLDEPIATWEELIDFRRLESTIGRRPFNWFVLQEVDAVIRPWIVRRACLDKVGCLDEAFIPTGWDEADLAFRIREAGWRVATHGYERLGAFVHLGSSTFTKFSLNLERDLQNGLLFHERWDDTIRARSDRPRRTWLRRTSPAGWLWTLRRAWTFALPWRRRAIITGQVGSARGPREESESAPAAENDDVRRSAMLSGGGAPRALEKVGRVGQDT
jgi:glycosyltransferase involved in cell wall biosynthesis